MTSSSSLKWFAFGIASLFFLFEFVTRIEPSLAVQQITTYFNLSNAGFGTLSSLFFWVYAPMQLVVGLLLDRYGARRFILPAIFICASGVLIFAAIPNSVIGGIGRAITGLGASFAFVGALYVVNHNFPARKFALLSGAVNAIGMIGAAIGAVVLTSFIGEIGWRSAFFATGAAGFVLFCLAFVFLRDGTANTKMDMPAQGFVEPLLVVVRNPHIWLISMIGALYYMPINVFGGLWGNTELAKDHGLLPLQAETAVSMVFLGMALGSISAGALSDFLGHRKWIIFGGSLLAAACFAAVIYTHSHSELSMSALLFFGGYFSGAQMLTFAIAKEGQPTAISGTVIAFVNMIGIGAALVFQPLVGKLIDMNDGHFGIALSTIPICLVVSAALSIFLKERRHADHIA